jgi:hypothetical protein
MQYKPGDVVMIGKTFKGVPTGPGIVTELEGNVVWVQPLQLEFSVAHSEKNLSLIRSERMIALVHARLALGLP